LIAAAGPLAILVIYSFLTPGDYGGIEWDFSLEGWRSTVFQRDIFDGTLGWADAHLTIFGRSLVLSISTTFLTLVFGVPTAWFIATQPPGRREFFLFLVTIPFWTNILVRTIAIQELIRAEGVINLILLWVGIIDEPIQMMFTNFAIGFGMTYVFLPLMVLPVYAAIETLDFQLVEAAHDLYAKRWTAFRRVILPLIKPGIIAGSILVFIPSLGAYVTPTVLGGGKNLMFGNLIGMQFGSARNWPLGAALALLLTVAVLAAMIWHARATAKENGNG
jgi:spermidine/putrescine transport system permease protein